MPTFKLTTKTLSHIFIHACCSHYKQKFVFLYRLIDGERPALVEAISSLGGKPLDLQETISSVSSGLYEVQ